MWIEYNPNPLGLRVGDCVIRAISKALDMPWEKIYVDLCLQGFMMGDLPSSNAIWSAYLKHKGFKRHTIWMLQFMEPELLILVERLVLQL